MKNETTMNALAAVRYLATEFFPEEIPLCIRSAGAYTLAEDFFGETPEEEVAADEFVWWATDFSIRPLAGEAWVLVDLTEGGEPIAVLEPKAEEELAVA
jgi:hypothetical protein